MSCGPIQVLQSPDSIDVKTSPSSIQLFQNTEVINVCAQNPVSNFLPYSFTATQANQTVFGPLPAFPVSVITLAITGTLQNPDNDIDYVVNELTITLNQGVNIGDTVYGIIQIA